MGWHELIVTIDILDHPYTARAETFIQGKIVDRIEYVKCEERLLVWFTDGWYLNFEVYEDEDENEEGGLSLYGYELRTFLGKVGGFDLGAWLASGGFDLEACLAGAEAPGAGRDRKQTGSEAEEPAGSLAMAVTIDILDHPYAARAQAFLRGKVVDRIEYVDWRKRVRLWFTDDWYLEFEQWEDVGKNARGYPVVYGHGLRILLGKKGGFDVDAWLASGVEAPGEGCE